MALTTELNGLLQTQGVTAAQAQQAFGLPPDSTDWMKNVGVKFASNPTQTSVAVGGTLPGATPPQAAPNVTAPAGTASKMGATGYGATDAAASLMDARSSHAGVTTGQASTFTPGADATVQGQIAGITANDSPLMKQAETRALQEANTHGLMNSSMAVQGGQAALYAAALPIAQQDASMYASTGQFNAGQKQQMELSNDNAENSTSQFNASADNQRDTTNAQLGTQVNLTNAASRNAASEFSANAQNTASQFNATAATDMSKFNVSNLVQTGIVNQQQANAMSQFLADQKNRAAIAQLQQDNDVAKFNASQSNTLQQMGIDSATKVQLADIEASYKTLMQTSASASDIYKTLVTQVAAIQSSKDMDAASKSQAISNLTSITNSSLGLIGDVANLNLPELDFGAPAPGGPSAVASPQVSPQQQVSGPENGGNTNSPSVA